MQSLCKQSLHAKAAAINAGATACWSCHPSSQSCRQLQSSSSSALCAPQHVARLPQPFTAAGRSTSSRCRVALRAMRQAASKQTIAITGATGLVGSRLTAKLAAQGNKVRVITRNVNSARSKLQYPGLEFFSLAQIEQAVTGSDAVVNLAGEPIGTRWTPEIKRQIKQSRLDITNRVAAATTKAPESARPKVLVSSSAVGYYGASQTASFTEDSPAGRDYLASICTEWEAAAQKVPNSTRVVIIRTGIVLAQDGGVLARMLPIFELFAGGPLGTGKQWVSWIHRDDLVELIIDAIKDPKYSGVYNGTAPKPVTMAQLCSSVGNTLGRPSWLPVPDFAITTLLGEGAQVRSFGLVYIATCI
eukprot:GHRR01025862.1.p1 GENE.GHRR01025862.1~~GHRR01025862.1.p1  ORF type:complete len:360 (+),score=101.99 GHRR01025862.1:805-1884(+)